MSAEDLIAAVGREDIAEVKDLVRQRIDPLAEGIQGKTAVRVAFELGSTRALGVFFRNGIDPNAEANGFSLLWQALFWGKPEMVEYLIGRGASVHVKHQGFPVFWWALMLKRENAAEVLLRNGADLNKNG